jgi:hypothetical protein
LVHQLGHTRSAAGALQAARAAAQAGRVHGHAAGVIAPVFEPLQALNEDGNDVAGRNGADDATPDEAPKQGMCWMLERSERNFRSIYLFNLKNNFINTAH